MSTINKQYLLAARPIGLPKETDFEWREESILKPEEGQILVEVHYISLDPAMRGWMNDQKSYIEPVQLGDVMRAGAVGIVLESNHAMFKVGDWVTGGFGVQSHAISDGKGVVKVYEGIAPMETYLGALGMPGLSAYFGFLKIGQPKEGDTVVVSGAAGAVGSVVGQIAKIKGCKVVGIAGGPKKCDYIVNELGFDAAVDYKKGNVYKDLREACPKGIDIYYDNVGGDILDIVLTQIRKRARIVICGAISQYNTTQKIQGPSNYLSLLVNRAKMEGFVVFDHVAEYQSAAMQLGVWLGQGDLKAKTYIVDGIENFPSALLRLFNGDKFGKLVIKVRDDK